MKKRNFKDQDISSKFEETAESKFGKGEAHHPDALTANEILTFETDNASPNSALESLLKKMTDNLENIQEDKPEETKTEEIPIEAPAPTEEASTIAEIKAKSLLDKCMPYILDENGNDTSVNSKPLYELASVAEILKADSQRTLEKLSKEYGIVFEDMPKPKSEPQEITEPEPEIEEPEIEEELKEIPIISDIDIPDSPFYKIENEPTAMEETVTFTPLPDSTKEIPKISVTTQTKPLNFTGELLKLEEPASHETEEVQLEKSEFEEYTPKNEYTDNESGKKLLKGFAKLKKNVFFAMWGSILLTALTAIFKLPMLSDVVLTHTKTCMIISSLLVLAVVLINIKSLLGLSKIFTSKSDSDILVSLASIAVLIYSVFGIMAGEIIINTQLLMLIILSFNSAKDFMKASTQLRSFKQIFNASPKHSISLINDPAITMAMTKGSVEGDCLIAAPQGVSTVEDFMKYSTFGKFLNGQVNIITVISVLLAVAFGLLSAAFYDGAVYGFYTAAAVLCLTCLPSIFLIDTLPLYHSSKKLAICGSMIAGKTGADIIEQANAIVLNSKDIFPAGTVTMHRMEVLSENNLEDTIVRAASLTEALASPLAPIFKKIAGTGNITVFPDSDTVKYEEAMGISGWVDNRLLFIGNRTLMEAHGISVPDVEVDRKILRQGFFPVYVADQNKACALIIINYDVDPRISKELRRLTASGVTVLVKSSDPNLTEEMICDYLGLYEDSVKVMTAAGCHLYVNSVISVKSASAPAAFKTSPLGLPTIINCAGRIKRSNIVLIAAYIISAVFGVLMFAYTSFGGSGTLFSDTALLIYSIVTTVVSYLFYITQKP